LNREKIPQMLFYFLIILLFSGSFFLPSLIPGQATYRIVETHHTEGLIGEALYFFPPQNPFQEIEDLFIEIPRRTSFVPQRSPATLELIGASYFQVKYQATVFERPAFFQEDNSPNYYLGPSQSIETNHPLLIYTARQVTSEGSNYQQTIAELQSFIHNQIQVLPPEKTAHSALTALQSREGSPADTAFLFSGLIRTRGIPARAVSGIKLPTFLPLFNRQTAGDSAAWAEIHTPEKGWQRYSIAPISFISPLQLPFLETGGMGLGPGRTSVEATLIWHNTLTWLLIYWGFLVVLSIGGFLLIKNRRSSSSFPPEIE